MRKWLWCFLFCLLFLSGCGQDGAAEETLPEGQCYIYYLDISGASLVRQAYQLGGEGVENQLAEAVNQMRVSRNVSEYVPAIPDTVRLLSVQVKAADHAVVLNFSGEYSRMKAQEEVLCRAAIVKTVVQIPGIDRVSFRVENQPLTGNDQEVVGNMSADSFVDSTWKDIKTTVLNLYFAGADDKQLEKEEREIQYYGTISMERQVVEELIAGPSEGSSLHPVMPQDLKILNVSTKDSICYVNLSSEFIEEAPDLTGAVTVYSIVNSLTELPGINKVQISVEGNSGLMLKEVSLEKPLERDLSRVKTE